MENKEPIDLYDKDVISKVTEVANVETGYYSWIRNNILSIIIKHKKMFENLLIGTMVKDLFESDNEILKVAYFTSICMKIHGIDEYSKKFEKKDWENHFIESFNNEMTDHQIFDAIKKILENGI